ncbi:hypothetical protein ES702_01690 [subsurface metagenome]
MNESLYSYIELPLSKERKKGADSVLAPFELITKLDYICVLTLDGTASLAFSENGQGDYFPLRAGMQIKMSSKRKKVSIINDAQPGKSLCLILGRQKDAEVIR